MTSVCVDRPAYQANASKTQDPRSDSIVRDETSSGSILSVKTHSSTRAPQFGNGLDSECSTETDVVADFLTASSCCCVQVDMLSRQSP